MTLVVRVRVSLRVQRYLLVNMIKFLLLLSTFFFVTAHSQITDNQVLNSFVKDWLGVPYKFGGKTKRGIDCSKLTQKLYLDVYGEQIPGVSWKQWAFTERVDLDSLQTGDLVFFSSKRSPSGWHVGLYLTDGYFFHAANRKDDVKISRLDEDFYRKNYRCCEASWGTRFHYELARWIRL